MGLLSSRFAAVSTHSAFPILPVGTLPEGPVAKPG